MKKVFIALLMIILTMNLNAEVWGNADFEDGTMAGASVLDLDGDSNNWEVYTYPVKDGTYGLRSVSAGLTPDNWVITPQIYAEKYSITNCPRIKFNVSGDDSVNYQEHYQVLVSFTDTDTSSFFVVHDEILTSPDWQEVDIDLAPYIGQYTWTMDMYIAFRHFDSDNKSALMIDDFMIYTSVDFWFDESNVFTHIYEGVLAPMSDLDLRVAPYDNSAYDQVTWDFIGYTDMRMHYIITDGFGVQPEDSVSMTLNDNPDYPETYIYTFPGQSIGTYIEYWFEGVDNSDFHLVGESQHFFVEWGEVTFVEEFDSDDVPAEWNRFHTETSPNLWAYDWETWLTSNVYSGTHSITSASQNNTGPCETENYLVTPKLRVDGKAKLKYYVNAETSEGLSESYIVLINNVGGDSLSVVTYSDTLFAETIVAGADDNVWYERTLDLEPWEGQFLWISFKHLYTPIDKKLNRYLNIDELSVAELPIVTLGEFGNACVPGEPFTVSVTATDYSGIESAKLYYSLDGAPEVEVVMTDMGSDIYSGSIPGQALDSRARWYIVVTDDSPYANQTTTDSYDVIWFEDNWFEWGTPPYVDYPDGFGSLWTAAIDWNFGAKENLYLHHIEAGFQQNETVTWKIVEFDGVPTNNVLGTLEGEADFTAGGSLVSFDPIDHTPITGHVALCFDISGGYLYLDESGDKTHAWQYTSSTGWQNNNWGAFYMRMYVSTDPDGIDQGEFIANTTELCQNYPNPFNPVTTISFFNKEPGDVKLSVYNVAGEEVATLVDRKLEMGYQKVDFDASKLNSGVYYYTLNTPEKSITKKMVLVK